MCIYTVNLYSLSGKRTKTNGGLKKAALTTNKRGTIVSKKRSAMGKRIYRKNGLSKWTKAFMQARKDLKIKGFRYGDGA